MKHASAQILEFEALRELVGRYISSPTGRAELARLNPGTDRAAVESLLAEAGEAIVYVRAAAQPHRAERGAAITLRFDSLADPTAALGKLHIEGACLEGQEIHELLELLERASDARALLVAAAERFPLLAARAARMGDFRPLLRELAGRIQPDGAVADDASPALARLRRDLERQQRLIQESLERFLREHRDEGVLQEEFVTIRNERFVVPVVAGRRRRLEGVIHAASGTGHTLFLEPLETIERNNELVRLREEESREVHRILLDITMRLGGCRESIARTVEIMGALELAFAKARFAVDFGGVIARLSPRENPRLALRQARHPLLEDVLRRQGGRVVPFSLELAGAFRTLVVSGPNTGGKSVTLKTVGLLVLMAQAGLPVPCEEAEIPLFDQVLADVGDQQSIAESLSTFSAHVVRLREMLETATADSLVLLDEPGRATDPDEGGALGVALVEDFRRRGCFTLVSTHLAALKACGASTVGVIDAAMSFDQRTLAPTYALRLGVPGLSAGLEIAGRLGLPAALVERARASMSEGRRDLARLLALLHEKLEAATRREADLAREQAAVAERDKALANKWAERESARLRELDRHAQALAEQFEARAREVIAGIERDGENRKFAAQARRRVAQARREFEEQREARAIPGRQETPAGSRPAIVEGARVRIQGIREPARVRRLLGPERIEVEAGPLRLQVPVAEVVEVLEAVEPAPAAGVRLLGTHPAEGTLREINVIGLRAQEARDQVDKFLDQAAVAGVREVRIVHGYGAGVLRRVIGELLAGHPHVTGYQAAPAEQGGAGATVAALREQ